MGNTISKHSIASFRQAQNHTVAAEDFNCKIALWQIPYNEKYLDYDTDGNKWFEAINEYGENEIENAEKELNIDLDEYKAYCKTVEYSDKTKEVTTKYPSGTEVKESYGSGRLFVQIRDKLKQLVAEKLFNKSSNEGRKIIYKNVQNGNDVFTIVQTYSYDTSKNRSSDVVNYGYTSDEKTLSKGCKLDNVYYMLNGKEINAEKITDILYCVTDANGRKLTFKVE